METNELNYWKAIPLISGGAFIGIVLLVALRVEYYRIMQYQPHMAPDIAYFFTPEWLIFVLLVGLPLELIFRKYQNAPVTKTQAFLLGTGYSTILTWWAFPDHWYVFLVVNPIIFRWLIGITILLTKVR